MVEHQLGKQIAYYRRLACILGACCLILTTSFVVLVVVAWPCLASPSTAQNCCACPTVKGDVDEHLPDVAQLVVGTIHDPMRRTASTETTPCTSTDKSSATSSSSSSSSGDHGHGHAHDAMLFLFNAIIIGVLVLHLTTHPKLHFIQHTSSLFVLGMCYSLVQEGLELHTKLGVLGRSYTMWMDIDPHLILFTLLPALLAGDAMAIDTSVVKRVANQCIYLAGPGVLMGSMLTAGFIMLYFGWNFELALTMGAILAATDPVAVVSLLKQLGASPTLTVQIAGESLLNDGTAIVLYIMAYEMLQGATYDVQKIAIFIVRKALCACGLGWVIGWVFVIWINAASNRFEHHSSTIQICLTLCCAYWSFIMAEGVLDMSGVLCTVAASIVLADKMWMSIVEKESMTHVWHIFDFLGNSLIFFLAGALTGNCMVHIPAIDYLHLLVLYVVSMLIRALIVFGSRPILKYLSPDGTEVKLSEALIMTVGGLRGAVGLALAIQVSANKTNAIDDPMDARRVLFFTGGIATLTLVINASACPSLVKACGLVQTDDTKKKMLLILHETMTNMAMNKAASKGVRIVLKEMLTEVRIQIDAKYDKASVRNSRASTASQGWLHSRENGDARGDFIDAEGACDAYRTSVATASPQLRVQVTATGGSTMGRRSIEMLPVKLSRMFAPDAWDGLPPGPTLVANYKAAKEMFDKAHKVQRKKIHYLVHLKVDDLHNEAALLNSVEHVEPDPEMVRAAGCAFLSLVRAQYWHQIEKGEFIEGSSHPEVLLGSIAIGLQDGKKLTDFDFIVQEIGLSDVDIKEKVDEMNRRRSSRLSQSSAKSLLSDFSNRYRVLKKAKSNLQDVLDVSREIAARRMTGKANEACAKKVVDSTSFNAFMTVVILASVLNVFMEEAYRQDQNDDYSVWLIIEIVFNVVFFFEFVVKFMALNFKYFKQAWNIFDFALIVIGIIGVILELVWLNSEEKNKVDAASEGNVSQEARIFRLNRVFRVMRLVRVFRLVKFIQILRAKLAGNEISLELAKHLRKITLLTAYIKATQESQEELVNYFGVPRHGHVAQARCLVESQTNLMRAGAMALMELRKVNIAILENLSLLRESGHIADSLSEFICEAAEEDVISAREAENLLAPLRERQRNWHLIIRESEMGIIRHSYEKLAGSQALIEADAQNEDNVLIETRRGSDLKRSMMTVEDAACGSTTSVEAGVGLYNSEASGVLPGRVHSDKEFSRQESQSLPLHPEEMPQTSSDEIEQFDEAVDDAENSASIVSAQLTQKRARERAIEARISAGLPSQPSPADLEPPPKLRSTASTPDSQSHLD